MLQAFMHSKRKLDYLNEANPFIEDTLTSSIFGLLRYLPDDLLNAIWQRVMDFTDSGVGLGNLKNCTFWPRWDLPENTRWREPDVFCEFEEGHIIIEAKRFDSEVKQYYAQWENELAAYRHAMKQGTQKTLFLFAIGGLGGESASAWHKKAEGLSKKFDCTFIFMSWSEFWLRCIMPVFARSTGGGRAREHQTIFNDIRRAFHLFEITTAPPKPMGTFPAVADRHNPSFHDAMTSIQASFPRKKIVTGKTISSFPQVVSVLRPVSWSDFYD